MRLPRGLALAAAASVLALAACGPTGGTAGSSPVATTSVDLRKSYKFVPAAIVVTVGQTVSWTNHDNFTHSVQFDGEAAPGAVMKPGETASHTFSQPGTYHYICNFHPQDMRGTVLVTGAGSENP